MYLSKLIFLISSICIMVCSCTSSNMRREERRAFNPAEYAYIRLEGSSTVRGEVMVPQKDGSLKPCSGCEVTLNPATSYSEEFFIKTVQNGIPIEEPDIRIFQYIKKTVTNDSGHFTFENIGSGKYFIYAPVKYYIPNTDGGYKKIDTYLYESVFVRKDEELYLRLKRD